MTSHHITPLMFSLVVLLVGCSNDERWPTHQVTGIVVFPDGAPLKGGWVLFECPEKGVTARGVVDIDGTYCLGTYDEADGAVAGLHHVAITPTSPEGYDPDQGRERPIMNRRFMHMDTSGLEFEVTPDAENHITIALERN